MIIFDCFNAIGLVLNTIAAVILVKNTYGFESSACYMSETMVKEMAERNKKRHNWQKNGLRLLMLGFFIQSISMALPIILSINSLNKIITVSIQYITP